MTSLRPQGGWSRGAGPVEEEGREESCQEVCGGGRRGGGESRLPRVNFPDEFPLPSRAAGFSPSEWLG